MPCIGEIVIPFGKYLELLFCLYFESFILYFFIAYIYKWANQEANQEAKDVQEAKTAPEAWKSVWPKPESKV